MAKKPPTGICVYCHKESDDRTWDHVLPLSWYPETTPKDMEKWKVPVCRSCNQKLGKIENALFKRLGLCLDPTEIASLGIAERALRAVRPSVGKSEKDRLARAREREKLLEEVIHLEEVPEGVFPGFGAQAGVKYDEYHVLLIPEEWVQAYAQKLVRGMAFVLDKEPIPEDAIIELYIIKEDCDKGLMKLLEGVGSVYHRGFGFQVVRSIREDGNAWIYGFLIWQKMKFYVIVHFGDMEHLKD